MVIPERSRLKVATEGEKKTDSNGLTAKGAGAQSSDLQAAILGANCSTSFRVDEPPKVACRSLIDGS
jgi:hypothetical protein